MKCPQCGGAMQDQRATKTGNQPDFVCGSGCVNDKGYAVGVWLKPKPAPKAAGPGLPVERGPKHTWTSLGDTYQRSMLIARKSVLAMGTAMKLDVTMADLLAATHTIFITAARDGVKAPAPEPEPEEAQV